MHNYIKLFKARSFWLFFSAFFLLFQKNAYAIPTKNLVFPDEKSARAWIGPERSVNALFRFENYIYLLAADKNIVLRHPFDPKLSGLKRFNEVTDSLRFELPKDLQPTNWRAVEKFKNNLILLESVNLTFSVVSMKDVNEIHRFTIPRDILKANSDLVGAATRSETARIRAAFSKEFLQAEKNPKFTGLVLIPDKIKHDDKVEFLVLSKLPSFSLLKIGCTDDDNLASCRVQRACDLPLKFKKDGRALNGLSYSKKRELFLFGDHDENKIYTFRYKNCTHINLVSILQLPAEIKSFSQLQVDEDDRLWVTSFAPDARQDAAVVYFENW